MPSDAHKLRLGSLELDLACIDADLEDRMALLEAIRGRIECKGDQREAFIRGTTIAAHLIAALARGQGVDAVLGDLSSLTRDQVEAAVEYAKAYPKRGRSYPTQSLKSTLADAGAFDDDGDLGEASSKLVLLREVVHRNGARIMCVVHILIRCNAQNS